MQLSRQQRGALNAAAVNRAYMARTGLTYSGQRVWTTDEVVTLRRLYPDYGTLILALQGRTREAIGSKVRRCGFAKPRRIWSEAEFTIMKPLYMRGAPMPEILGCLDNKTKRQVWAKAASRRIRRPRRAPRITGLAVLDAIRRRAFDLRLSMTDLDELAGRRGYFRRPRRVDWDAVQRILPHLGGRAMVSWHAD